MAVDPPRPESPRRAATRSRLLDAAYEVFSDVGLEAASVEQVTERAGFTRGAFYSNFSSKEGLFLALYDREHEQMLGRLEAALEALGSGAAALDELVIADLLLAAALPDSRWCILAAEFALLALRDGTVAADYLERRDRALQWFSDVAARAGARVGRRFTLGPERTVRLLVAASEDAIREQLLRGQQVDAEAVRRDMARLVLALTTPAPARRR